jgi:hypothetical protein
VAGCSPLEKDDGKKVNAIKFYDIFDRVGCILFKSIYQVCTQRDSCPCCMEFDAGITEKIHVIFSRAITGRQGPFPDREPGKGEKSTLPFVGSSKPPAWKSVFLYAPSSWHIVFIKPAFISRDGNPGTRARGVRRFPTAGPTWAGWPSAKAPGLPLRAIPAGTLAIAKRSPGSG